MAGRETRASYKTVGVVEFQVAISCYLLELRLEPFRLVEDDGFDRRRDGLGFPELELAAVEALLRAAACLP